MVRAAHFLELTQDTQHTLIAVKNRDKADIIGLCNRIIVSHISLRVIIKIIKF